MSDMFDPFDYRIPIVIPSRCIMTRSEEEKARLDLLANCIIEDSERVTIPDNDMKALHAEIARLTAKCARYEQALIDIDKGLTRLISSTNITRSMVRVRR